MVFYALLCASFPFSTEDRKSKHPAVKIPPSLSEEASDLLQKLLTANPKNRIHLKDAAQHPWFTKNSSRLVEKIIEKCNKPTALYFSSLALASQQRLVIIDTLLLTIVLDHNQIFPHSAILTVSSLPSNIQASD